MKKLAFLRPLSHFISKTIQTTVIVTMKDGQELICSLSNGAISSDVSDP